MNSLAATDVHARASAFLYLEGSLIDAREWDAWESLYASDGIYWIPSSARQQDAINHVSIAHDNQLLRRIRVQRLKDSDGTSLSGIPSSSHHISNVSVVVHEDGGLTVRSRLIVAQSTPSGIDTFYASCTHILRDLGEGDFRIALKQIDLLGVEHPIGDILTIL